MNQFGISAAARSDLDDIWLYIAQHNIEAADRLISAIVSRFPKLAAIPELGRQRPELGSQLRSFPVGRHVIFYHPMKNGIEIVRVLHGARDLPPLLD